MCFGRKGYTLIELLICLVLMGLVIMLLMSFFTANLNNSVRVKNDSELQFQAQYVLNFISNKVMESNSIADIRTDNNTTRVINLSGEFSITKISLLYNKQDVACYIFEVDGNTISYGKGKATDSANAQLGKYISELKVAPFPRGITFAHAQALEITVKLAKGNETYEATQLISMRSGQR